jgi:hypothetical protein
MILLPLEIGEWFNQEEDQAMLKFSKTAALSLALVAGIATLGAVPAGAGNKKVTESFASAARTCAASACNSTKTGRAFSGAVKAWDRAGWEAGRYLSTRRHGPAGDPGRYPGLRR